MVLRIVSYVFAFVCASVAVAEIPQPLATLGLADLEVLEVVLDVLA